MLCGSLLRFDSGIAKPVYYSRVSTFGHIVYLFKGRIVVKSLVVKDTVIAKDIAKHNTVYFISV